MRKNRGNAMIARGNEYKIVQAAIATLLILVIMGCGVSTTGPSIDFKPAAAVETDESADANQVVSVSDSAAVEDTVESLSPRLGYIRNREAIALDNGGRVPLGEDKVAEVFLSPYPPQWQTDLHLFLMNKETFDPITEVDVDLEYEMVYMDHGIDALKGTKIADGHYILPLSFLMYGDWNVDTRILLPEGKMHLEFIVKFYP